MSHARTIGVLGGGQLGRMIALAGIPLGFRFRFLDPSPDAPAGDVGDLVCGRFDDNRALLKLGSASGLITYEFENVPVTSIDFISQRLDVFPPAASLAGTQDRLIEKRTFNELGVRTTRYATADTQAEFEAAVGTIGLPCVVKTRRDGYDGKGQAVIRHADEVASVWPRLGDRPLLVEEFVAFEREVSIIGVRAADGRKAFYPLVQNRHENGILRLSIAPAPGAIAGLQVQAERAAAAIMDRFEHVGVFTIEFFVRGTELIANEMAPRVHNSGHWTIEGAVTSQFENHVRAIAGLPLGSCRVRGASAMVNIVGSAPSPAAIEELLSTPGVHLHDYAKEPRSGRKLGHVTVTGPTAAEIEATTARLLSLCPHE